MTRDEQKSITEFVTKLMAEVSAPLDVEADAIIRALFVRNPEAAYRVTILAMAQQAALHVHADHVCPALQESKAAAGWLGSVLKREPKRRQSVPAPIKL